MSGKGTAIEWVRRHRAPLAVAGASLLLAVIWIDMFLAIVFTGIAGMLAYQVLVADVLGYREGSGHDTGDDEDGLDDGGEGSSEDCEGEAPEGTGGEDAPAVGGWHCRSLYLPGEEGGQVPEGSDAVAWSAAYHARRSSYGVDQAYDPARAYREGEEGYLLRMSESGVAVFSCEYLEADGDTCRVPRARRPESCRWLS